MNPVKPMLAGEAVLEKLKYPVYATPKIDGVRAMVTSKGVMSRNWLPIPNKQVQKNYGRKEFIGFDGELIVGLPTAPDVFRRTSSSTSRIEGKEMVVLYVFDVWNEPHKGYAARMRDNWTAGIKFVDYKLIRNEEALLAEEERRLTEGYEGLILRSPDGLYKHGRSTTREGGMLKLKRFKDSEAAVIEVVEELENQNVAEKNAFGRTKRSSHKENMIGKGRMGSINVRDLKTGVVFNLAGFDAKTKKWFWEHRKKIEKRGDLIVKYKYFPLGSKDRPRFPSYQGIRHKWDL